MPHYHVSEAEEKIPAGWLIEQCGWKGRTMGRAGVYAKQALVLVNMGGATGEEITALCHAVQRDVKERFGIDLKPEVNIV
jgi:UDP-N-acetylmuramate dehydrogenase